MSEPGKTEFGKPEGQFDGATKLKHAEAKREVGFFDDTVPEVKKDRAILFNSASLSNDPEEQARHPIEIALDEGIGIYNFPYGSEEYGLIGITDGKKSIRFNGKPTYTRPEGRIQGYWHWYVSWAEGGKRRIGWISTYSMPDTVVGKLNVGKYKHKGAPIVTFRPDDAVHESLS